MCIRDRENIKGNIASSVFFYSCVLMMGFAVILFGVSRLITKPLGKLEDATGRIEKGDFDVDAVSYTHLDVYKRQLSSCSASASCARLYASITRFMAAKSA